MTRVTSEICSFEFGGSDKEVNNQFAVKVLDLPKGRPGTFPVLKRLALSGVSLAMERLDLAKNRIVSAIRNTFNFGSLVSSQLRHCRGWADFINAVMISYQTIIRLKRLETQTSHEDAGFYNHDILWNS